jgi:serine protease Do
VTLGRLKEEKQAALTPDKDNPPEEKPAMKKALGLDLADLTASLRTKHKIKEGVKGVLITGVKPDSEAADQRLVPGMVISEVQQEPVNNAADLETRIAKLRKDGKQTVVMLVVTPDGNTTFVALKLE